MDKAPRFRWMHKPSEILYKNFEEGKHVANHISNSVVITNKFKLIASLKQLEEKMKKKTVVSSIFDSPKDFLMETYVLEKNR